MAFVNIRPRPLSIISVELIVAGFYGCLIDLPLNRLHQLDAIFAISGAFERDSRLNSMPWERCLAMAFIRKPSYQVNS